MQRELLQEKNLTAISGNEEKTIDIDLSSKSRLLPYSSTADMFSLNDLYIKERDECNKYRMIFTVNPICTNVLYNSVTEPVFKEGSDSATSLIQTEVQYDDTNYFPEGTINKTEWIGQKQAVKDTEYSHERIGNFEYHCGYDIFNNHLLRTMDFEHVGKSPDNDDIFNTIEDYVVNYDGKTVLSIEAGKHGEAYGPYISTTITDSDKEKVRMYQLDNIKTMDVAFYDGLRVVDGWYGFYNSGYINLPNTKLGKEDIYVNNLLNNKTRCGFIDLYPDRSLYSFIPKVNRYRRRVERNWDCTIVYPFENDYDTFNILNGNEIGAIKVLGTKVAYNNVGEPMIELHSLLRNTLEPGSQVRLYYIESGKTSIDDLNEYPVQITVNEVGRTDGTDSEHYFRIRYYDIETICFIDKDKKLCLYDENGEESENAPEICFFYKKIEDGYENRYYFRKFKQIRNGNSEELEYTQNKIAYGENIYGDRVAQVIFTDDIDVSGLRDNFGRPLSKVYFTADKTNRGHKEWYEEGNVSAETVEYSHCFGDVTSGLDLPVSGASAYNVRKLHNVFTGDCVSEDYKAGLTEITKSIPTGDYNNTPQPLETGITLEGFEEFYGDIVEFNKANFTETPIESVYHRFNTTQRECLKNKNYFNINYDELVGDTYDVSQEGAGQKVDYFKVESVKLNYVDTEEGKKIFPGNINPEGYFYKPFYEVVLKDLEDDVQYSTVRRINFDPASASLTESTVTEYNPVTKEEDEKTLQICRIVSPVPYKVVINQPFCIYDIEKDITARGYLFGVTGLTYDIVTDYEIDESGLNGTEDGANGRSRYFISIIEENVPIYAEFLPNIQRLVWRGVKKMSELTDESTIFNMPFLNGRNYIHKNIDFFVRRQDPHNEYRLYRPSYSNPLFRFQVDGAKRIDLDQIREITDSMINSC